jgi:phospholipid/cholesterol/gamma-HCH transport system substrate-binding protein
MTSPTSAIIKLTAFASVATVLTVCLFAVFGQYRTGSSTTYTALFSNVSRLKTGDSVRIAGIRVGTVHHISIQPDHNVLVAFDTDRDVALTLGTTAAIRYLNLVGDRYLDLVEGPGPTQLLAAGAQIPLSRTMPALDLDLLLGGLKPVIRGLNPQDVNALTSALLQVFQGQGDALDSLLSRTSSFAGVLADDGETVERLIDNLNRVLATLADDGSQFAGAIDRLQSLVSQLSQDRAPIGDAIDALAAGTNSIAGLLTAARPPLKGTVAQLNRLAPLLDEDKARLEHALIKAPENYRKLVRLGAYGSFIQYYICGISFRVTDLQGRTAVFPWTKQEGGRCAEPQ